MEQERNNPFELAGRVGPAAAPVARVWTEADQEAKIADYLEVPPEYWHQIKYGTHVRYFTKAEGFRPGGFVLRNPFDTKPNNSMVEKRFMKLRNGFNDKAKNYQQWIVAYEDVDSFYIKPDASSQVLMHSLKGVVQKFNKNNRTLQTYIVKLEARIVALESGQR